MNRRESLKALLISSIAGGLIINGCSPEVQEIPSEELNLTTDKGGYGRTEEEKLRDKILQGEQYFTTHELATIAVLSDIILPPTSTAGSATDAEVPEFIEFIAKDLPFHKLPLRGGIMWLDHYTNKEYGLQFINCTDEQQISIIDKIAFPQKAAPGMEQGVKFFNRMRNLVLTGYYTTKMGIEDLGYKGNTPNVWDGVPQEVLDKHGLKYEQDWLAKCIDQQKRTDIAQWDEEGNLI